MNINAWNGFHVQAARQTAIFRIAQPQTRAQSGSGRADCGLQGVAKKILDTYESENRAARIKGQAIELANYASAGLEGLDDERSKQLSKDDLMEYLHGLSFTKAVVANGIHVLNEVKDSLKACDQATADYQDMLDGKTEIPKNMSREDVEKLMGITQKQREKCLRAGNEAMDWGLGILDAYSGTYGLSGLAKRIFGGNPFAGEDTTTQLDTSASTEDILAQIDDVIGRLSNAVGVVDEGIHMIAKELDRRDALDEKIKKYIQMISGSIDSSYYTNRVTLSSVIDQLDSQDRYEEAMRTGNYIDHGSYIEYSTYG